MIRGLNRENFNWGPGLFLIIYQIILWSILPFYFYYNTPSPSLITISIILYFLSGLGITAGYHRLYAHKSYKVPRFVEAVVLFFGSVATQGSALRWANDHRLHHAYVDTDQDPYSINKGFWYAHFFWLLEKPQPIDPKIVPDLIKNPLTQFQHKHAEWCMLVSNLLIFAVVGWLLNDFLGAFLVAVWLRMWALHHSTWFINSLAHTWGDKPFCQEQSAVNNFVISLLTFGEGYHNYHHTFAQDYRNGIRWYHFDPTKWLIWFLYKIGLANSLKRVDSLTINKRMVIERQNLLLEKLREVWYVKKDELEQKVKEIADNIIIKIATLNQLRERYYILKKEHKEKQRLQELRVELNQLKKSLKEDWHEWIKLSHNILRLKPLPLKNAQ